MRRSSIRKNFGGCSVTNLQEMYMSMRLAPALSLVELLCLSKITSLDGAKDVYEKDVLEQLGGAKQHGFVELCVSDGGVGIPASIAQAYIRRYKERHGEEVMIDKRSSCRLLKFTFDELGTSKDESNSWITDRHALSQMLFVVAKYAGVLTIRSGRGALTYWMKDGYFKRCSTQMGFEPGRQHELVRGNLWNSHSAINSVISAR